MKKLAFLSFAGLLLWSCNTPNTANTTEQETTQTATSDKDADADEEATADNSPIALNNGQKWEVNAEMKPFVEKGKSILDQYVKTGGTDYTQLAADLKSQDDQLIKSCTMTGTAHEELHKWLHPHLGLVEGLKNCKSKEAADSVINKLAASYNTYIEYFD